MRFVSQCKKIFIAFVAESFLVQRVENSSLSKAFNKSAFLQLHNINCFRTGKGNLSKNKKFLFSCLNGLYFNKVFQLSKNSFHFILFKALERVQTYLTFQSYYSIKAWNECKTKTVWNFVLTSLKMFLCRIKQRIFEASCQSLQIWGACVKISMWNFLFYFGEKI